MDIALLMKWVVLLVRRLGTLRVPAAHFPDARVVRGRVGTRSRRAFPSFSVWARRTFAHAHSHATPLQQVASETMMTSRPVSLASRASAAACGTRKRACSVRATRRIPTAHNKPCVTTSASSALGGSTIALDELAADATSGNPLIGITPDRVPMVEAASRGDTPGAGSFNWQKQWYPVAVIDLLDPQKPHPTQLLGVDIVVWRNGDNKWSVFEDKCPHRLAPLSEGRVEDDGTLLCAYHAWRFDDTGACTDMPQANSVEEEERIKNNPRSKASARPSMEAQGLVWAWGEAGPDAKLESAMTPALLVHEIEGVGKSGPAPGGGFRNHWQVRDMPYGWASFFENVRRLAFPKSRTTRLFAHTVTVLPLTLVTVVHTARYTVLTLFFVPNTGDRPGARRGVAPHLGGRSVRRPGWFSVRGGTADDRGVWVPVRPRSGTYFPLTTFRLPDCPYKTDISFFTIRRSPRSTQSGSTTRRRRTTSSPPRC